MDKPSIIQAAAVPKILASPQDNFLFQAINGSGKTLSFGVPAILTVDASIAAVQVIIIANTRELIRQVQQVLGEISQDLEVGVTIGDNETPEQPKEQIIVTVPGWIEKRVKGKKKLNLKNVKMVVYDEADEIYLQDGNHKSIAALNKHFQDINVQPQNLLFSATFPENVVTNIRGFIPSYRAF